ncbi:lysozyme inhibitor LprI family protein [Pantanalinema rosaneae CENA516]|uniref:lysozyme inhibitor LprI family protein n=1 Tax=Pantanalinema rosaneae TaxID=1620701 RepID=UPI003D6F6DEA
MPNKRPTIALTVGTIAVLLGSVSLLPTHAQSPKPNCQNPQTQVEMNYCAAEQAKASDRKLNQVYQRVRASYKGTAMEEQLVDAQLAWIKFRDTNCQFARNRFQGGSMAPLVYSTCVDRMTQDRTQELEQFMRRGG